MCWCWPFHHGHSFVEGAAAGGAVMVGQNLDLTHQ